MRLHVRLVHEFDVCRQNVNNLWSRKHHFQEDHRLYWKRNNPLPGRVYVKVYTASSTKDDFIETSS